MIALKPIGALVTRLKSEGLEPGGHGSALQLWGLRVAEVLLGLGL